MKDRIGLGFMGCGGHSARHADVVRKMPDDYTIVGAFDTQQRAANGFLKVGDGPALATTDLEDFLALDGMNAVLIGTPHEFHLELCEAALKAGMHVLCEKPLWEGEHREKAERIIERAARCGLIFSSCHLRRYEEEFMYVKAHLPEYLEKFGKALEVRFQFFYHEPHTEWKMNDSLLLDHMNHEIDLVHFLFGYNPASFWRLSHGFDEYRVAGRTESGLAIWFSGYRRLKSRIFRNELELIFETGRVRTETVLDSATGIVSSSVSTLSFEDGCESVKRFRAHSYNDALVGVMRNFAAAIRGEEACYLTADDLLTNTGICNVLMASEHGNI